MHFSVDANRGQLLYNSTGVIWYILSLFFWGGSYRRISLRSTSDGRTRHDIHAARYRCTLSCFFPSSFKGSSQEELETSHPTERAALFN